MKSNSAQKENLQRTAPIIALYIGAAVITAAGAFFGIYSFLNGIMLPVMSNYIPGAPFGAVIAFLGVRYLISVNRLQRSIVKDKCRFSWNNFGRHAHLD